MFIWQGGGESFMFAFVLNGQKIISFVGGVNQKVLANVISDFPYKALDEGPHLSIQ